MSEIVSVKRGQGPIVLSQPHGGVSVPDDIYQRFNSVGRELSDTDWHINKLYDGLLDDVTVVQSLVHRYVIDMNRDPSGLTMYPGQNTTSLCPLTDFDRRPIYKPGLEPDTDEIKLRIETWHKPYHDALSREIKRILNIFGYVILYDCHSIRSTIPFLFQGELPVFSIGTNSSTSCLKTIENEVFRICQSIQGYETVLNGRFKGGWITRHYGNPNNHVHVIQMELAQRSYMNEFSPWQYRNDIAGTLRIELAKLLTELTQIAESGLLKPTGD